jgi:hypothetical protein
VTTSPLASAALRTTTDTPHADCSTPTTISSPLAASTPTLPETICPDAIDRFSGARALAVLSSAYAPPLKDIAGADKAALSIQVENFDLSFMVIAPFGCE